MPVDVNPLPDNPPPSTGILPGGDSSTYTLATIKNWLEKDVLNLLLTIAAGVAIIMIIYGAFMYLTAYGNEEQAEKGKKTILWTVIGIIVIILADLIKNTIVGILGA